MAQAATCENALIMQFGLNHRTTHEHTDTNSSTRKVYGKEKLLAVTGHTDGTIVSYQVEI
jgi:putative flippase GtrA